MTLSGATTPDPSAPERDGYEGILHNPQSSCITGASPSDCFTSYSVHSLEESYPSAEMQSVYSSAPADFSFCVMLLRAQCFEGNGQFLLIHTHTHTHTHIYIYICVCVCVVCVCVFD